MDLVTENADKSNSLIVKANRRRLNWYRHTTVCTRHNQNRICYLVFWVPVNLPILKVEHFLCDPGRGHQLLVKRCRWLSVTQCLVVLHFLLLQLKKEWLDITINGIFTRYVWLLRVLCISIKVFTVKSSIRFEISFFLCAISEMLSCPHVSSPDDLGVQTLVGVLFRWFFGQIVTS